MPTPDAWHEKAKKILRKEQQRPRAQLHDWDATDSQGYSMECSNGCGAAWTIYGDKHLDEYGPCYN